MNAPLPAFALLIRAHRAALDLLHACKVLSSKDCDCGICRSRSWRQNRLCLKRGTPMKVKLSMLLALGLVILSALPAAAQPANSKITFGLQSSVSVFAINFKADATPTAASTGFGKTVVNFTCGAVAVASPHCLPSDSYTLTLVDSVTKQAVTWARIGKATPPFATPPGVPAGSTATFTAALNLPNSIAVVVDVNGTGAARSATFSIEVAGGTITTLPTITVTQQ